MFQAISKSRAPVGAFTAYQKLPIESHPTKHIWTSWLPLGLTPQPRHTNRYSVCVWEKNILPHTDNDEIDLQNQNQPCYPIEK